MKIKVLLALLTGFCGAYAMHETCELNDGTPMVSKVVVAFGLNGLKGLMTEARTNPEAHFAMLELHEKCQRSQWDKTPYLGQETHSTLRRHALVTDELNPPHAMCEVIRNALKCGSFGECKLVNPIRKCTSEE